MAKVGIVIGSKNDYSVVKDSYDTLKKFGIETDVRVMSAHRTPEIASKFANEAINNGYEVIIAAAGKAAHLAGVIAGHTTLPVIGLPIKSLTLDGLDSLLSTVQMPNGIPVATVAINGAINAALLAVQILAISDKGLREKLIQYKKDMEQNVINDDNDLRKELV